MKTTLIFDDDCGICSSIANLLKHTWLDYSFLEASRAEDFLAEFEIDKNLTSTTIILLKDNETYIEAAAVFEIISDLLGLRIEEKEFLFNKRFIKFFDPLYRYIAYNRKRISVLFGLKACRVR